ncbi:MAG: 5-formyltetrahydrofolate cyclo-ligase [Clostridia bacterium]
MTRAALRVQAKRLCEGMTDTQRRVAALAVQAHVCAHVAWRDARTVMLYASIGTELDTRTLLARALADGKRLLLPRCRAAGMMDALPVDALEGLEANRWGIPEPREQSPVPPDDIDLVLVPGLCFDREGNRLGHGGGYYDRYLSRCSAYRMALLYEEQLLEAPLPHTSLDVPMDALITPRGVCTINRWEDLYRHDRYKKAHACEI